MRFLTTDGAFGFVIWTFLPAYDKRLFGFQLVIAGQVVGDAQPSILGSAMHRLRNLYEVDDARLARPGDDPDGTLTLAVSDDALHDLVVFSHAESLDESLIAAYRHQGSVSWLVRGANQVPTHTVSTTVTAVDYDEVVEQVVTYWTRRSA